jgi:signal transduction histidine kinase
MSKRVLLVDDEAGIRKVLGISLTDMGYAVETAADGAEALDLYRKSRPPIVLTDIKMPGMDGIELLHALKSEDPDTEVIMITGHGDLDAAVMSLKYQATDFVAKPINDDVLEIALRRAEERIGMRRQIREYTGNLERLVEEKSREIVEAEKMAAVGQTVADLSHAIKNIAGGLKGGAFVLEKGIELDDREYLRQGWRMLKGNLDKITKLSLDLLDYARSARMNPAWCDPNEPVREVAETLAARIKENGIDLILDLAEDLGEICVDPDAVHRCLLNLVTNAVDACKEAASEPEAPGDGDRIRIETTRPEAGGVIYRISDNGCGMTPEVKEKIFTSFFTTKGTGGSGIGLMLTKKIVDEHGGKIDATSEEGEGAAISLWFPESPKPNPPGPPSLRGKGGGS